MTQRSPKVPVREDESPQTRRRSAVASPAIGTLPSAIFSLQRQVGNRTATAVLQRWMEPKGDVVPRLDYIPVGGKQTPGLLWEENNKPPRMSTGTRTRPISGGSLMVRRTSRRSIHRHPKSRSLPPRRRRSGLKRKRLRRIRFTGMTRRRSRGRLAITPPRTDRRGQPSVRSWRTSASTVMRTRLQFRCL